MSDNQNSTPAEELARVIHIVNNFFYAKLTALPTIKEYMERFQE